MHHLTALSELARVMISLRFHVRYSLLGKFPLGNSNNISSRLPFKLSNFFRSTVHSHSFVERADKTDHRTKSNRMVSACVNKPLDSTPLQTESTLLACAALWNSEPLPNKEMTFKTDRIIAKSLSLPG